MSDTDRRTIEPWWVAGVKWLLASFLFPAVVAGYVLVAQTGELKAIKSELGSIRVVLEERLPKAGR